MFLLSAGDLVEEGTYEVHSRFNRVVNFSCKDRLATLVEESIGPGPVHLVMRGANLKKVHTLAVSATTVRLDGISFHRKEVRTYDSRILLPAAEAVVFRRNLRIMEHELHTQAPPKSLAYLLDEQRLAAFRSGFERAVAHHIAGGVQLLLNGEVKSGIGRLSGCGFGLTPSGDDFIAGVLIGLHARRQLHGEPTESLVSVIYHAAGKEGFLSRAFLRLARLGRVGEGMKRLLLALGAGDETETRDATARLLEVGATSGADLGTGLYMSLKAGWSCGVVDYPNPKMRDLRSVPYTSEPLLQNAKEEYGWS